MRLLVLVLLVASPSLSTTLITRQQPHKLAAPRAQSIPSLKQLLGTWKRKSGGPAMTFLPDSSFVTGEGEGGVGHGTYSLSGDALVLTYHTEGAPDNTGDVVLYNRIVIQGQ